MQVHGIMIDLCFPSSSINLMLHWDKRWWIMERNAAEYQYHHIRNYKMDVYKRKRGQLELVRIYDITFWTTWPYPHEWFLNVSFCRRYVNIVVLKSSFFRNMNRICERPRFLDTLCKTIIIKTSKFYSLWILFKGNRINQLHVILFSVMTLKPLFLISFFEMMFNLICFVIIALDFVPSE